MDCLNIIDKKYDNKKLNFNEIEYLIEGFLKDKVSEKQMSSFLMAVINNGLDFDETVNLTKVMAHSGKILDFSEVEGIKIDKHSTGGVGDKISLVFCPLMASCGFKVLKMSGRSLGFTGGTIDKLESIPGIIVNLKVEEMIEQVKKIGICIVEATKEINPADKKIYELRDKIGTISNISLIASSIISKKIAGGADQIILDVKCGNGAFFKNLDKASEAAEMMVDIGKALNKKVMALVTRMDGFLGNSTGNLIEIKEAVETLKGRGSEEIKEIVIELGKPFLIKNKLAENEDKAEMILKEKFENREAYNCFQKMVTEQGGEEKFLHSLKEYPKTKIISEMRSPEKGFINEWNGEMIGEALNQLGAGRKGKKSRIDHSVSIYFHKKVGNKVEKGDLIAEIFANNYDKLDEADSILSQAICIEKNKKEEKPLILKRFV